MERPKQLFRDFGLTFALLFAAVLIYWKTTVPALRLNRELDQKRLEMFDQEQQLDAERARLDAKAEAITDPIEIEREQRAKFGTLGLPGHEVLVPLDEPPPANAKSNTRAPAADPAAPAPKPGG
jgi:hypothetical protein